MGYYTDYSLTVKNIKDQEEFDSLVNTLKEHEIIEYALDNGWFNSHVAEFSTYDAVKWYDSEKDMMEISKLYPGMYFMLEGSGEEFGDLWREYFKNGITEHCNGNIVFEKPQIIPWEDINCDELNIAP